MIKQAVYLVGGLGTRLGERTAQTPKPLLSVAGRPFLEYLMHQAAQAGFTDICLLAGFEGQQVIERYQGYRLDSATVRVLAEPERLGTAGALRWSLAELDDVFLLANGDSFIDIDLRAFTETEPRDEVCVALIDDIEGDRYGRVGLTEDRIDTFLSPREADSGPINGGVYRLPKSLVQTFPEGPLSLEADVLPGLAKAGRLRGVRHKSYFIDIGVPADFARAEREFADR